MTWLLKQLVVSAVSYGLASALTQGAQAQGKLRHVLIGVAFLLGATLIGAAGVVLWLVALFFYLAGMMDLVRPAVVTGLIALVIVVSMGWYGIQRLRRSR